MLKTTKSPRATLNLETLEARTNPSNYVQNGSLHIDAWQTPENYVTIEPVGWFITKVAENGRNSYYSNADLWNRTIFYAGGYRRDIVLNSTGMDMWAWGWEGNDLLMGGSGNDHLFGDGGDDTLYGFGGNDDLRGGWNRVTLYGGYGNDWIDGGAGDGFDDYLYGDEDRDGYAVGFFDRDHVDGTYYGHYGVNYYEGDWVWYADLV